MGKETGKRKENENEKEREKEKEKKRMRVNWQIVCSNVGTVMTSCAGSQHHMRPYVGKLER
jgi:hypothetical protein